MSFVKWYDMDARVSNVAGCSRSYCKRVRSVGLLVGRWRDICGHVRQAKKHAIFAFNRPIDAHSSATVSMTAPNLHAMCMGRGHPSRVIKK